VPPPERLLRIEDRLVTCQGDATRFRRRQCAAEKEPLGEICHHIQ
jgi:hypothetical protein